MVAVSNRFELELCSIPQKYISKNGKHMVKGGCWDIPRVCVGSYGFYVIVQCFFLTVDYFLSGDFGTILPLTFTVIG
jgi:hypothetical protein